MYDVELKHVATLGGKGTENALLMTYTSLASSWKLLPFDRTMITGLTLPTLSPCAVLGIFIYCSDFTLLCSKLTRMALPSVWKNVC